MPALSSGVIVTLDSSRRLCRSSAPGGGSAALEAVWGRGGKVPLSWYRVIVKGTALGPARHWPRHPGDSGCGGTGGCSCPGSRGWTHAPAHHAVQRSFLCCLDLGCGRDESQCPQGHLPQPAAGGMRGQQRLDSPTVHREVGEESRSARKEPKGATRTAVPQTVANSHSSTSLLFFHKASCSPISPAPGSTPGTRSEWQWGEFSEARRLRSPERLCPEALSAPGESRHTRVDELGPPRATCQVAENYPRETPSPGTSGLISGFASLPRSPLRSRSRSRMCRRFVGSEFRPVQTSAVRCPPGRPCPLLGDGETWEPALRRSECSPPAHGQPTTLGGFRPSGREARGA